MQGACLALLAFVLATLRPAQVGRFLSHYKSGALPKVFKVIPALAEWEDVLFLTNPETVRRMSVCFERRRSH